MKVLTTVIPIFVLGPAPDHGPEVIHPRERVTEEAVHHQRKDRAQEDGLEGNEYSCFHGNSRLTGSLKRIPNPLF